MSPCRQDNIATPTLGTELPSDPIERFSSPADKSTQVQPLNSMPGAPTGFLGTSARVGTADQPSPLEHTKALPTVAADSDDEMPSVTSIIQQESREQQRLHAIKQVALQHADTRKSVDNDSEDDDLLIVKDDMHSVAREEAAQRRLNKAYGSPTKDRTSLQGINHPSVRPATASPRKLSKQELQELAKPSFARMGKGLKSQLSKMQLDQLMIMQHTEEQLKSIKRQEEEWVRRGGRLSRDTGGDDTQTLLSQKLKAYAEQGLKAVELKDGVRDEESADESDEEYTPDPQDFPSPKSVEEVDMLGNIEVQQDLLPPGDDDDDNEPIALRHNKHGRRRPLVVVGSDDESVQPVPRNLPNVQRDSTSSMESQTEDENDKENSANLMYDRSEDKENKAIVRHKLSSSELAFGSRLGSLRGIEDGAQTSQGTNFDDTTGSPKGDVRSPLKDISKGEDDLFLSPSSKSPFTDRLLQRAGISPRTSPSTLVFASSPVLRTERISQIDRLSLDSENDEDDPSQDPSGFKALQPSFLERLQSQTNPKLSLDSFNPLPNGGFSQLFSVSWPFTDSCDLSLTSSYILLG